MLGQKLNVKDIGVRLKNTRENLGKEQEVIAQEMERCFPGHGIKRQYIGQMENGKLQKISFAYICFLMSEYNINIQWLLYGEGGMYEVKSGLTSGWGALFITTLTEILDHLKSAENRDIILNELDKLKRILTKKDSGATERKVYNETIRTTA